MTSASSSLCQVWQEFGEWLFTEITSFILAERAPFADQEECLAGGAWCATKDDASAAAGQEGWGGLENVPALSHALQEETNSWFVFSS